MRYTHNQKYDWYIQKKVSAIVNSVVSMIHPDAIYLGGSYARGEGVVEEKNNKPHMISDFDVYVFTTKDKKNSFEGCTHRLIKELNLNNEGLTLFFRDSGASLHDDINNLDLISQAKLLYGEPLLKKVQLDKQLCLQSSLRFLMNRTHFLLTYLDNQPQDLLYTLSRVYAEMSLLLCSVHNVYVPTYKQRADYVKKLKTATLRVDRIANFTYYKIGAVEKHFLEKKCGDEKEALWRETVHDLFEVLHYALIKKLKKYGSKTMNSAMNTGKEVMHDLKKIERYHYTPQLKSILNKKQVPQFFFPLLLPLLSPIASLIINLQYMRQVKQSTGKWHFKGISLRPILPSIFRVLLLYIQARASGSSQRRTVQELERWYPCSEKTLREDCISAWNCYKKITS